MLRTRGFWFLFALASLVATFFAFRYFGTAYPSLTFDIRMDRDGALTQARALAEKHAWPPSGFDQAVRFTGEPEVQNFIELEGGGKEELGRILRDGLYYSRKWRVRHFKEGDTHETSIHFTPEGKSYGFAIKLPEQEAGANLEVEAARQIAEQTARDNWQIDFTPYQLAESSKELQPGGRTDHTFVYERQDVRAGEGRYRLRLVVGGDKLTELTHFIQVPEAFKRRYEEMRSANDSIGAGANIAMVVVYLLGCCGIGLFFMMRHRWLEWRHALYWAIGIGLLTASELFNFWSLIWMNYDTALPASGYAIRQIAASIAIFLALGIIMFVSFMAAETLGRRAFPHHVQFWRLWSRDAGASKEVLGYTIAGYLMVGLFFAYEVALYAFAHERLGWWTPSDTLADPDIFAAYLPSLTAAGHSLQAGFWEECLFRAVPLASAALIGDRFGKRRLFIIIAMIVQALIFGAGHAGYATQPAYARIVELIIPSFAFGALYLAFGLLPGIILHYAFDMVWFSIPLFFSSAPRAVIEQVLVVLMGLIPLGIVILRRIQSRGWVEVPQESVNRAWQPRAVEQVAYVESVATAKMMMSPQVARWLPIAGVVGLVLWIVVSSFRSDAPPLSIGRAEAETIARQAVAEENIQLDSSWRALTFVAATPDQPHRFIWQKAGREKHDELLGTYLPAPRWNVRFTRFEGDVAARAEEHIVAVSGDGRVLRIRHELPEAAPGASLSEDEAREPARNHVLTKYAMPADNLQEVSAEASKRPARTDWEFVFRDTRDYGLPEGEPRIAVTIAGDKIVDANRYIHVPEEWARNERAERNLPTLLNVVCIAGVIAIVMTGAVVAVIRWSRKRPFSVRAFLAFMVILFILSVIGFFNSWPGVTSQLSTAQPFMLQVVIVIAVSMMIALCASGAVGLVAGLVMTNGEDRSSVVSSKALLLGASFGAVMAGIGAFADLAGPSNSPQWSGYSSAGDIIPFVAATLTPAETFLRQTLVLWIVFQFAGRLRRIPSAIVLTVVALFIIGSSSVETIASWLAAGLVLGLVLTAGHNLIFRHQPSLLPLAMATIGILSALKDGLRQPYPAAFPGAIAASVLIGIAAWLWFKAVPRAEARETVMESATV